MPDCSLIVVAHAPLASSLVRVAQDILGELPETAAFDIELDCDSDVTVDALLEQMQALDQGAGVLLLCDLKGATPGNIATRAHLVYRQSSLVFGVNLPMLLRSANYIHQPHADVAKAATEGACNCIIMAD
jgi:PTS system ascorbate-specific IIA component